MTEPFETRLQSLAQSFRYPPTPQVAARVMAGLNVPGRRRFAARRWAWGIALAVALAAGLMAVPPVRAAVLEFIQIGIVRIFLPAAETESPEVQPPATAVPGAQLPITATPAATVSAPLTPLLDRIAGETTLAEVRAQVEFSIRLPAYPPALGVPDRVFFQDLDGDFVVLVWLDSHQPDQVDMSLHIIGPGSWAISKIEPVVVQATMVNGQRAIWAIGPYPLILRNSEIQFIRLVEGHVLIWTDGEISYRLETNRSLEEAIKIAESLEPVP